MRAKKTRGYAKGRPLGATIGGVGSALDFAVEPDPKYGGTVLDYTKGVFKKTNDASALGRVAESKALDWKTYKWLALGIGVSASKRLPGLRIVARPLDRVIRDMTKGKWGL